MDRALKFLEAQLMPAAATRGDAETLRLAEETRSGALDRAEQEFFLARLRSEISARRGDGSLRVLIVDLGGAPDVAPRLLRGVRPSLAGFKRAAVAYARLDPNPAGRAQARRALDALRRSLDGVELSALLSSADPARAALGPEAWAVLRQSFDLVVALAPGGAFNSLGGDETDAAQRAVVGRLFGPADLTLLTLLAPAGLRHTFARLRAVRDAGAAYDAIRLRVVRRAPKGLIFQDELELPLGALGPQGEAPPEIARRLAAAPSPAYLLLGVAAGGPTFVVSRIFDEAYLRRELFPGFAIAPFTAAAEGWITALRYVH